MRHEAARQRKSDGRWDYTTTVGDLVRPIGYCRAAMTEADWQELADKIGYKPTDSEKAKAAEFAHKHHTDGHAMAEEAQACYREYLLDHHRRAYEDRETMRRCQVCEEWTNGVVEVDSHYFHLCRQHQDRQSVASLLPAVGERYVS